MIAGAIGMVVGLVAGLFLKFKGRVEVEIHVHRIPTREEEASTVSTKSSSTFPLWERLKEAAIKLDDDDMVTMIYKLPEWAEAQATKDEKERNRVRRLEESIKIILGSSEDMEIGAIRKWISDPQRGMAYTRAIGGIGEKRAEALHDFFSQ